MTALTIHPTLSSKRIRADISEVGTDSAFHAQNPYPNGVVVYSRSGWNGNGFGNHVCKVAVLDGEVVGVYERDGHFHHLAEVAGGSGTITADVTFSGAGQYRRSCTTKTALSKWITAVKELR